MKTFRIILASLLIFIGVFGVLCGGSVAGIIGLIGFGESNQDTLAFIIPAIIGIIALYISYLIIKYGIRWVKRIKGEEFKGIDGDNLVSIKQDDSHKTPNANATDLMTTLSQSDISNIDAIFFIPANGQAFIVKTPNIKRLVVYITNKMEKTIFEPEELRKVFDYVVQNISSDLSKRDFDLIRGKIEEFVKSGGEVKIEKV